VFGRNIFGVRMNHGQSRIHKIHHGLDLGEATTFPIMVYFVPGPKCHFVPKLPSESLEIPTIGTLATLGVHNFACRLLIEIRSEAKLYPLSKAFQGYVAHHPHARKLGLFLTFSGQESNCQFDSQLFFWP